MGKERHLPRTEKGPESMWFSFAKASQGEMSIFPHKTLVFHQCYLYSALLLLATRIIFSWQWVFFLKSCQLSLLFSLKLHLLAANDLAEPSPELVNFFTLEAIEKNERGFSESEKQYKNTFIRIRGFLYQTEGSLVILAAEPNLKSCCIGSGAKRGKQVLVCGNVSEGVDQAAAILLQGNLFIDRKHPFPFQLKNARIIAEEKHLYRTLAIAGGLLILVFAAIGLFRKLLYLKK